MTTAHSVSGLIPDHPSQIVGRPLDQLGADKAALTALLQAAVNVELFTIPLYMCAMKSIQGTHAINSKGIDYYQGRVWPGRSIGQIPPGPDTEPAVANQKAYNLVFSVFIDEMLHLQMAANLSAALGVTPNFNSAALQDADYNWTCYGPHQTVIPHILDLTDINEGVPGRKLTVELTALTADQVTLFEIIEQNHDTALEKINPDAQHKYFPAVPFAGWTAQKTETDLPLFGTIGWMYYCLLQYTTLRYTDNVTLFEKMLVRTAGSDQPVGQRDLFNNTASSSHPMAEYPGVTPMLTTTHPAQAHLQAIGMMWAICDQGEGGIDWATVNTFVSMVQDTARLNDASNLLTLKSVLPRFQPSKEALEQDYPSYTDTGAQAPQSDDATARADNGGFDHHERFEQIAAYVQHLETWTHWHASGHEWTAAMLTTPSWSEAGANPNIPKPADVAAALNALKLGTPRAELDNVVKGALAGITTVLSDSWENPAVAFPFPSMVGSGDRMALYWAVYGEAPTLRAPNAPHSAGQTDAMHACQSLSLDAAGGDCAAHAAYHSCKGSNLCATQGGCGFVQPVTGGGNCSQSSSVQSAAKAGGGCGAPTFYSAPADNLCKSFGGCAVPISASQLYPTSGTMKLYDHDAEGKMVPLTSPDGTSFETLAFAKGDSVYDIAWGALEKVWAHRQQQAPAKPAATTLRIALPPST